MSVKLNIKSSKSNISSQCNISVLSTTKNTTCDISQSPKGPCLEQYLPPQKKRLFLQVLDICRNILKRQGVHSVIAMSSGGFHYTGDGDTARCSDCGLEVSEWTLDMKPFAIHAQRNPACPFVRSILLDEMIPVPITMNLLTATSTTSSDDEKPTKRQITEATNENCRSCVLVEVDMFKQIRRRTLSHWPHRTSPSSAQMIEAGFFNCKVRDRVICLHCNLIYQQWVPNADHPWEVHKTLSPKCPYVLAKLAGQQILPSASDHLSQWNPELNKTAHHQKYVGSKMRHASFSTWSNENLPSVDALVQAGFFYTGIKTMVTCFYCNGSLTDWGLDKNPMIEHASRFPHCAYAKHLCGDKVYTVIQERKRRREDKICHEYNASQLLTNDINLNSESVQPSVNNGLSPLVEACLDLPISRNLLAQNFKLSTIRRCWEDQLKSKNDDFPTDADLLVACMIIEKQIELGAEEGKNIIIPSEHIKKLNNLFPSNPCLLCSVEEKRLACIPCGHYTTCVSCSHSLRSCPICRKEVHAFVNIYI